MNPDHAVDANRRRNRGMLVALFVLFFGAMLVAGLLRFSGWRPEGSKNKGEMLQPYGDLRGHAPVLASGGRYRWTGSPRTWRIVTAPDGCAAARTAACTQLLQGLDTVWQLMGKEADRVHVLWVADLPPAVSVPEQVRHVRMDERLRSALVSPHGPGGDAAWLVDPNGFVVLRYAPGFDPGDVRTDLARLLKIN